MRPSFIGAVAAKRRAVTPPAGGTVTFRGAGTTISQASSATVSLPMPTLAANDLLVACVLSRSALTVPSGWTLLDTVSVPGSGITQYANLLTKTAVSGDFGTSVVFTQATTARMLGRILAFTGSTGTPTVESKTNATGNNQFAPIPALIAAGDGRMGFLCNTAVQALTGQDTNITASAPWTTVAPAGYADNRLAEATVALASGASTAGSMTNTTGAVDYTMQVVILKAP